MSLVFYVSGAIAVISAMLVVTRVNVMHALVSLIVAFLAMAGALWALGAAFAAVLQIVVYAGAIMVLFVFVVMILNMGRAEEEIERGLLQGLIWAMPALLAAVLLGVMTFAVTSQQMAAGTVVAPKAVGESLFSTYLIGVELASALLLAGLVAAFHFGGSLNRPEADDE